MSAWVGGRTGMPGLPDLCEFGRQTFQFRWNPRGWAGGGLWRSACVWPWWSPPRHPAIPEGLPLGRTGGVADSVVGVGSRGGGGGVEPQDISWWGFGRRCHEVHGVGLPLEAGGGAKTGHKTAAKRFPPTQITPIIPRCPIDQSPPPTSRHSSHRTFLDETMQVIPPPSPIRKVTGTFRW